MNLPWVKRLTTKKSTTNVVDDFEKYQSVGFMSHGFFPFGRYAVVRSSLAGDDGVSVIRFHSRRRTARVRLSRVRLAAARGSSLVSVLPLLIIVSRRRCPVLSLRMLRGVRGRVCERSHGKFLAAVGFLML